MDIGLEQLEILKRLAVALAAGFLIGLERGWSDRDEPEGQRMAGIRTFGLISLLGALWSLVYMATGSWAVVLAFLGFCGVVIVAEWLRSQKQGTYGITTPVAALITFAIGAVAALGQLSIAASAAVVVALLLGMKPQLHAWLRKLEEQELFATLKLLLISVVMLPVLPDKGYGPWQVLNPYLIWWMVVLVAGISYCGYFAIRIAGPRRGILLTALSGGLVSSTAVTVTLSRMQSGASQFEPLYAIGIILASATMFPRVMLWAAVVSPDLLPLLLWPIGIMTLSSLLVGLLAWRGLHQHSAEEISDFTPKNPFEIGTALQMGALLAAVMLLAQGLQQWFGDAGIYLLAAISGIGDVDAITLTVARMAESDLMAITAVAAITVAAIINTLTKAGFAAGIGGRRLGTYVGLRMGLVVISGMAGLAIVVVLPQLSG